MSPVKLLVCVVHESFRASMSSVPSQSALRQPQSEVENPQGGREGVGRIQWMASAMLVLI